ncbi:MAG: type II toxin-antitoxin system VapC family toxin [Candidatus Poribacteria bacterium]|nr:type II toxin-antitoxin system VapC family toxin [Candidatus Poribacteria bacterium]
MNYFWLDANAIAKRYVLERGTRIINHLFTNVSPERMICLFDSMDETRSVMVRKRNRGEITLSEFKQAIQQFETEVINSTEVLQVHATVNQKVAARELIDAYSINSTDAYILQCVLDKAQELQVSGDVLILVSSDKRLLNAAKRETLRTFDPETDSQAALDVLIDPP